MSPARLTFQNWIVALGRDPSIPPAGQAVPAGPEGIDNTDEEIGVAVRRAIETLTEQEKFFIIRYYFMGQGYAHMSRFSGRAKHRLAAIHQRALRKLRTCLAGLVCRRYGIETEIQSDCVICQSPFRGEIDALIADRDQLRTWRPVIETLKSRYSLVIKSPQILIGHEKYH